MPNTYYGPHAEKYSDYANAGNANLGRWPLGHILILPDHREYRFTLNDGTVEVAGNLYQSVAPVTGHTNIAADTPRARGSPMSRRARCGLKRSWAGSGGLWWASGQHVRDAFTQMVIATVQNGDEVG